MTDKVYIITVNYKQNQFTVDCINSLLQSEYSNFEILLINNGATETLTEDLQKNLPKDNRIILYNSLNNLGYVGGVNYGLEICSKLQPGYVLIMNNDTIIDKDAISQLVITCKKYMDNAIISGKVYHYDEPNKIQDLGYYFENTKYLICKQIGLNVLDVGQFDMESERDMLDDVFWLFPFKLYNEIGGYSKYFWFNNEQADFALRAKKAGYKLIYTPLAKIWHKGSQSIGGREFNPILAYYSMQGALIYRYIHLTKLNFWKYYLKTGISIIMSFIKNIFQKKKGIDKFNYNLAKLKGFNYFNLWLLLKNENTGKNPFN